MASTAETPTPILTLSKCIIRPYSPSDVDAMAHAARSPNVARFMTNSFPSPYTVESAKAWVAHCLIVPAPSKEHNYAMVTLDGTLCGGIGLRQLPDYESRTLVIGYWLGEDHWGQGITTEAVRGFSKWAFETFPETQRLEASVMDGNAASVHLLKKAGYVFEGTRRKPGFKNGAVIDVHMLGLLREECPGLIESKWQEVSTTIPRGRIRRREERM